MSTGLRIAGGRVLDPASGVDEVCDVYVRDGRFVTMHDLADVDAETIDATGLTVVPGLIDFHVHVYEGVSHYGIDADRYCIDRGVTTALDAGSAGSQTFPGLARYVLPNLRTEIYCYLNVSSSGLLIPEVGELEDDRYLVPEKAIAVAREYPDLIVGIKVRIGRRMTADTQRQFETAKSISRETGLPLMVHITDTTLELVDVLSMLEAGDTVTHCFHGKAGKVVDEAGQAHPYVLAAMERGVLFDVGHGRGSFSFDVARAAVATGASPQIVSSDLHVYCADGPAFDQVTTMSKMIHVGMPFEDVIEASTIAPARAMGKSHLIGSLAMGHQADVTILDVEEGQFAFGDTTGATEVLDSILVPRWVVKRGVATQLDYQVHAS